MKGPRYVGGIPWEQESTRPPQEVLTLTETDYSVVRRRISLLQANGGEGVRYQLLDGLAHDARLLITGKTLQDVARARDIAVRLLDKGSAVIVNLHPYDMSLLHRNKRALAAEIERESACRVLLEDPPKSDLATRPQHAVHLLGDQAAQSLAVKLLTQHCSVTVLPDQRHRLAGTVRENALNGFSAVVKGYNIALTCHNTVARREGCKGCSSPGECVVAGDGAMGVHDIGAFFSCKVRQCENSGVIRGGTRIGVSSVPIAAPPPDSLQGGPPYTWVVGRGVAIYPDGRMDKLHAANFDDLSAGDTLGIMITKSDGAMAVFQQKHGKEHWDCILHWDAGVSDFVGLFPLIELAGRISEIECLPMSTPPKTVGRDFDRSKDGEPIEETTELPANQACDNTELATEEESEDLVPTLCGERLVD